MATISWADFEQVELRVGIITAAEINARARKPATASVLMSGLFFRARLHLSWMPKKALA